MLRDPLIRHHVVDDFRWRSREISRIEDFSDAVFGFAVTLLIVSLEVPRTSTELLETMHSFIGFVVTFFMLASIWYSQFRILTIFGLGFAAIFLIFILLYRHAYSKREELELNELEIFETRSVIRRQSLACGIGLLYVVLGFVTTLPHATPHQKNVFIAADLSVEVLMLAFLGVLIRLQVMKKKFVRAWKARNALAVDVFAEPPDATLS